MFQATRTTQHKQTYINYHTKKTPTYKPKYQTTNQFIKPSQTSLHEQSGCQVTKMLRELPVRQNQILQPTIHQICYLSG